MKFMISGKYYEQLNKSPLHQYHNYTAFIQKINRLNLLITLIFR